MEWAEFAEAPNGQSKADAWMSAYYKADRKREKDAAGFKISDSQHLKSDKIGGGVSYSIKIACKDGKYKFTINNFRHVNYDKTKCAGGKLEEEKPNCLKGKMSTKDWEALKVETQALADQLILALKEGMLPGENKVKGEDDW